MLIDCPYCGERLSEEFTILGDATKRRPTGSDASDMDAWYDYVFIRDNPKDKCPICFMPLSKRKKGETDEVALPP